LGVYFGYMGRGAKPLGGLSPKFFLEEGIRDVITCFKFGVDRLRGLASAEGQIIFAISHWLWRSSLQHSHTTVWACDQRSPVSW